MKKVSKCSLMVSGLMLLGLASANVSSEVFYLTFKGDVVRTSGNLISEVKPTPVVGEAQSVTFRLDTGLNGYYDFTNASGTSRVYPKGTDTNSKAFAEVACTNVPADPHPDFHRYDYHLMEVDSRYNRTTLNVDYKWRVVLEGTPGNFPLLQETRTKKYYKTGERTTALVQADMVLTYYGTMNPCE